MKISSWPKWTIKTQEVEFKIQTIKVYPNNKKGPWPEEPLILDQAQEELARSTWALQKQEKPSAVQTNSVHALEVEAESEMQ